MGNEISGQIDELGRLAIPADLLKLYGFRLGDTVWFSAYDNGILIHSEGYIYNEDEK